MNAGISRCCRSCARRRCRSGAPCRSWRRRPRHPRAVGSSTKCALTRWSRGQGGRGSAPVGQRVPGVEDDRQVVVVDVDQLDRVARLCCRPGHNAGHDLAGEPYGVDRNGRVRRDLLVRRDRPDVGQRALLSARSSPVTTATTPDASRAALTLIELMVAWATGLRTSAMCSMPGALRLSVHLVRPSPAAGPPCGGGRGRPRSLVPSAVAVIAHPPSRPPVRP